MDVTLKLPFSMLLSGPSGCGKTTFVKRLLMNMDQMLSHMPDKVVWCYGEYLPEFVELSQRIPQIHFIEGIPSNIYDLFDPSKQSLLIMDDLMEQSAGDAQVTQLFTKGSHHRGISPIILVQNIFYKGLRSVSLNCHYICLFKQVRDRSQSITLAHQMFPGGVHYFTESYLDATKDPFSYLLVDCTSQCPEEYRLRAQIFPEEFTHCYVKK